MSTSIAQQAGRQLGRTELHIPPLGFGGAPLGELFERLPEERAVATINAAIEAGSTFIDTAPWYGHGLSEHRIGGVVRQLDRDSVQISTKVGRCYGRPANLASFSTAPWLGGLPFELRFDYTAAGILRSYEDSLLRLATNRVECLVIHDLEPRYHPGAELDRHRQDLVNSGWTALQSLRARGEVRALGAGITQRSSIRYFLDNFELDFLLLAMPYTLLDQSPLHDELAECVRRGVGIIIGSPYASGILATGAVNGAIYDYAPAPSSIMEKTRAIEAVCREFAVSLQAAALQFPLAHPAVAAVIPGATSAELVAANVKNLNERIPSPFWETLKARGLILPDAPVPEAADEH